MTAEIVPGTPACRARPPPDPACWAGPCSTQLDEFLAVHEDELIAFRRDLHQHPELGYAEHRTTKQIAERLRAAGLEPVILPRGTGLYCDIGPAHGTTVALRADIDALPLEEIQLLARSHSRSPPRILRYAASTGSAATQDERNKQTPLMLSRH